MGYGEHVPGGDGGYWRGRYKISKGKYGTVRDEDGNVVRYPTQQEAKQGANDEESDIRRGRWSAPAASKGITLGQWAHIWYAGLDLAELSMRNYRTSLETRILPRFQDHALDSITEADIAAWVKGMRDSGLKPRTVASHRAVLHTCLEDAVPRYIPSNPARQKRGRGRRSGRKSRKSAQKVITGPLGALLHAERLAILSGRDDEFTGAVTLYYTGMRLAELTGLEVPALSKEVLACEWQLPEAGSRHLRQPCKDDSMRDIDLPSFLSAMLSAHVARTGPEPCRCHGNTYVFRGLPSARNPGGMAGVPDVAVAARVPVRTVTAMLNGGRVDAAARARIEAAVRETGFVHGHVAAGPGAHWRRSQFEGMFSAASSGWLGGRERHPVPLAGEWPGTRIWGRGAGGLAEMCWLPAAAGLTPHGLRHAHKSLMTEKGIPEVMSEHRLGHELPGLIGLYTHPTPAMRVQLLEVLTTAWEESLDARIALSPSSPVAVLDRLMAARRQELLTRISPEQVPGVVQLRRRAASF